MKKLMLLIHIVPHYPTLYFEENERSSFGPVKVQQVLCH